MNESFGLVALIGAMSIAAAHAAAPTARVIARD